MTRLLASYVEIRYESQAISLGPRAREGVAQSASDADDPGPPAAIVFARFQFTLRTLLLAALLASAASGWLGIRLRRSATQTAALAKLDSFKPSVFWRHGYVYHLSFSLSRSKPDDEDLEPLEELTGLRWLNLDGSNVTDAGMVHLRNLRRLEDLSLTGTRVTDAGLVHLYGLTDLESVSLAGTQVTDQGVARLREALPDVEVSR